MKTADELKSGDVVTIDDGDSTPYVVVDVLHSGLARVRPYHRVGRVVHPKNLTKVEGPRS